MKIALKAVIAVLLVIIVLGALVGIMAVTGSCPPPGPYPQPPWCMDRERFASDMSAILPKLPASPIPTVEPGKPVALDFAVSVPETADPVTLSVNGNAVPMVKSSSYYYTVSGLSGISGETLPYTIASGTRSTAPQSARIVRNTSVRKGMPWTDTPLLTKPGFMKGFVIMDAGGFVIDSSDPMVRETYTVMQEDGGEWFSYDYYWTYRNYTKPEIIDGAGLIAAYPDSAMLGKMVKSIHDRGMKFFLLTELEWNILPGEAEGLAWDDWFRYLNEKWAKGQEFDREMSDKLTKNPDDPEVNAYWDRWFVQFEPFMLKAATLSEENNVEMLSIGKQLEGAMNPLNEQRWRALIKKVRAVYHGKITQTVFFSGWQKYEETMPWADELDAITLYYYPQLSEKDRPSVDELIAAMEKINRDRLDPLYAKYRKPLIFITPFQSRDYAAKQEWFEPMASAPSVRQDLMAQADLYEAFFRSTADEPWCDGVFSWGFWIEPDFNPKYSFEKSSSVRSKPAELVLERWFATVKNQ